MAGTTFQREFNQNVSPAAIAAGLGTPVGAAALDYRVPISVKDPRFGAIGNGTTDDTAAFQLAFDFLNAAGGGTLVIPYGNYLWDTAGVTNVDGSLYYSVAVRCGNIRIVGEPGAKIVPNKSDKPSNYRPLIIFGSMKGGNPASTYLTRRTLGATVYAITGSYSKGTNSFTCTTPGDAANFVVGDITFLRTGQLVSASVNEPDSELLKTQSVDAGTGIIKFIEPISKPYAQEYFASASANGVTNTNPTSWPAVYGIANVTDRIFENVEIDGLVMETPLALQAISIWGAYNVVLRNVSLKFAWLGIGMRDVAHCRMSECELNHTGTTTAGAYFFGPSTGCSHIIAVDNIGTSATGAYWHIHEGVSDYLLGNNITRCADCGPNTMDLVSIVGRAYNVSILDNNFWGNAASGSGDYGIVADQTCLVSIGCCGRIDGNDFQLSGTWNGLLKDDGGAFMWGSGNRANGVPTRVSLRGFQRGTPVGHETRMGTFTGVVSYDKPSTTLGVMPQGATAHRVEVQVETAGNATSTNTLLVGWSGSTTALASSLVVSALGVKAVNGGDTPGAGGAGTQLGIQQAASGHTLLAAYAQTGTPATAGRFIVTVHWSITARVD
jgi:hypothetical protein